MTDKQKWVELSLGSSGHRQISHSLGQGGRLSAKVVYFSMLAGLIAWIVLIIPTSPILGTMTNEQVDLIQFGRQQAIQAGIDEAGFLRLQECESKINQLARGDYVEGKAKATGILQFWQKTWDKYSKKFNFIGSIENPQDQIKLAVMIISQEKRGIDNWWNCSRIAKLTSDYGK